MEKLVLEMKDVMKSYNSREVVSINHLTVYENEKIGIIGRNGQGKSTLVKMIAGEIEQDSGKIEKSIEFQYFAQIEKGTRIDFEMTDPELLGKLNIPTHSSDFYSGGEVSRLKLVNLFSRYTGGLLLDEPTTHLDTKGRRFLIEELQYFYGTALIVSHDRAFLDATVTSIWEVESGKVTVYKGNFSQYEVQKEAELEEQKQKHNLYVKEKNRLERTVDKKQRQATKLNQVSEKQKNRRIKPSRLSSSKQKDTVQKSAHKTVKAINSRIEKLEEVEKPSAYRALQFPVLENLKMYNRFPIRGEAVTIVKGNQVLLEKINFQFPLGKRIGITGNNGSGKTSLIQYILANGSGIVMSPKAEISTYNQMDYYLEKQETLFQYLSKDSDYSEALVRAIAHNLGFLDNQLQQPVQSLSGGEATKLVLAKMFSISSNILILDEPTNFIDLETIEALEKLMIAYPGTIVFTSHDQRFMDHMADQIWKIENRKLNLEVVNKRGE
ncbi:ribosomal protection-like ABC-F family protein [Marinilactibacillus sp. Marseille-P9653]|uniref:ribosomal protection-like ABC-F family protein n=1 Tax=Marinilactibacillus sp. Marseille-P9653 TaxID=2866583 RepID=UPI001CE481B2|nr:ABC-F type ribosomal protection protein [Marinilactibacillus sp. Marseille-P9653]